MSLFNYHNFQSFLILLLVVIVVESGDANVWVQQTEVPTSRNAVATAVVNGKIYIISGVSYSNKGGPGWDALSTVEVYDTRSHAWRKGADMPTPRIAAKAAVFAGEIYLIGGYSLDNGFKDLASVDVYEPTLNRWGVIALMPTPKVAPAVAVNGIIYVLGGFVRGRFSQAVQTFDTGFRAVNPKDKLSTRWGELKESN